MFSKKITMQGSKSSRCFGNSIVDILIVTEGAGYDGTEIGEFLGERNVRSIFKKIVVVSSDLFWSVLPRKNTTSVLDLPPSTPTCIFKPKRARCERSRFEIVAASFREESRKAPSSTCIDS